MLEADRSVDQVYSIGGGNLAILDAFRSFIGNAAKKHGVSASEVAALVLDQLLDPDPDG